jgi:NADH-quinone oxidoreductase subunit E
LSFTFTPENQKKADAYIKRYPKGRQASAVLPLLDLAQRQSGGWLPQNALEGIANMLEMPFIKVLEVASFYTMFNLKPVGTYHLQVCGTTPCWLKGAEDLKKACEHHLKIKTGETTKDQKFTLREVECLGACINAPVVQINDDYYENLSPESIVKLLKNLPDQSTSSSEDVSDA